MRTVPGWSRSPLPAPKASSGIAASLAGLICSSDRLPADNGRLSTRTQAVRPTFNLRGHCMKSRRTALVELSSRKPPFQIEFVFYETLVNCTRRREGKISK